jgi:hypothetical protein
MIDELIRAAVEQGAHDGAIPKNRRDARDRNPQREDESAWQHIVYRATVYHGEVWAAKLLCNAHRQEQLSAADRERVMAAYFLARG